MVVSASLAWFSSMLLLLLLLRSDGYIEGAARRSLALMAALDLNADVPLVLNYRCRAVTLLATHRTSLHVCSWHLTESDSVADAQSAGHGARVVSPMVPVLTEAVVAAFASDCTIEVAPGPQNSQPWHATSAQCAIQNCLEHQAAQLSAGGLLPAKASSAPAIAQKLHASHSHW